MRLKLVARRDGRSCVVTLPAGCPLRTLQQDHAQPLTGLTPSAQRLAVKDTGEVLARGAADPGVLVEDIVRSGSILLVSEEQSVTGAGTGFNGGALAVAAAAAAAAVAEQHADWACPQCTLINPPSATVCTVCGATRPGGAGATSIYTRSSSISSGGGGRGDSGIRRPQGRGDLTGFVAHRRIIPSDNSCLFNAAAFLLMGKRGSARAASTSAGSPAQELREVVVRHVRDNPGRWTPAVLGKSHEAYIAWIRDLKHWGGSIEMEILAAHFDCELVAVDIETLRPYFHGKHSGTRKRAFLLYSGVHYDAISFVAPEVARIQDGRARIASEEMDVTTVEVRSGANGGGGDDDDHGGLELCLALAQELQRNGQFTNLAQFKVQCLVCLQKFRGQAECVAHATQTGHQNFGEFRA